MDTGQQAAAYCRVSTTEQRDRGYGIEIQVRDATLFAERQGLFISRFYKDEAASGVEERRIALRELLRDCKAGRVRTVIIPSLDRLSRNVRLAENLFHEFERRGVRVLIADMPNYNGKDRKDVLIRQIREAIAEENRKEIIERLWKGRQERVRKGLPPGGNVRYGYRRNGNGLEIDLAEAEIVRGIFERARSGESGARIAQALNDQQLARRNGTSWTQRQVAAIISRRQLYQEGAFRYGQASGQDRRLALLEVGVERV